MGEPYSKRIHGEAAGYCDACVELGEAIRLKAERDCYRTALEEIATEPRQHMSALGAFEMQKIAQRALKSTALGGK